MKQLVRTTVEKPFVRFLIVGSSAFTAEFSSFFLLYYVLHIGLVISNGLSFIIGLSTSFTFNRIWTFGRKHQHKTPKQIVMYVITAGLNLLITLILVAWLRSIHVPPAIGKPLAMITTSLWNFAIFKGVIFKQIEEPLEF